MGLSAIKQDARLRIHNRMAEPCSYSDGENPSVPTLDHQAAGLELTARFHTKKKVQAGDYDGLSVMEPIESLVFNQTQLDALGLVLGHNAEITFPGYGLTVRLDSPLDGDGPENVYWTCIRA